MVDHLKETRSSWKNALLVVIEFDPPNRYMRSPCTTVVWWEIGSKFSYNQKALTRSLVSVRLAKLPLKKGAF